MHLIPSFLKGPRATVPKILCLLALASAIALPVVLTRATENQTSDPTTGVFGFLKSLLNTLQTAPLNAQQGPMKEPRPEIPTMAEMKAPDANGISFYPISGLLKEAGTPDEQVFPLVVPGPNGTLDGAFRVEYPTNDYYTVDWGEITILYWDCGTSPAQGTVTWGQPDGGPGYGICQFSGTGFDCGHWVVKAKITLTAQDNTTIIKYAYAEFIVCSLKIEVDGGTEPYYLPYGNVVGPRRKITLSCLPEDLLGTLPYPYNMVLMSSESVQPPLPVFNNAATGLRLWGSESSENGQLPWSMLPEDLILDMYSYDPYWYENKDYSYIQSKMIIPEVMGEYFLDVDGISMAGLTLGIVNMEHYEMYYATGWCRGCQPGFQENDSYFAGNMFVAADTKSFQFDELDMVIDGVRDERDYTTENEVNPGIRIPLNTGYDKMETDSNGNPIQDYEVPLTKDATFDYWADFDQEMKPLELKWWKSREVPLKGSVRFEGSDITHLASNGDIVYGKILIWRYDPTGTFPRWSPVLLKDGEDVPLPENVPADMCPFYVEGLAMGSTTIQAIFKPSGANFQLTDSANIVVHALAVDLDIDSDNTFSIESSAMEDFLENSPGKPGKFMLVNKADSNSNGIPDYAERCVGTDPRIAPVGVTIPDGISLSDMTLSFLYSAADDESLQTTGIDAPPLCNPLRLWKKNSNGTVTYIAHNVSYAGNQLTNLGFSENQRTVTLWLEAVSLGTTGHISESKLGVVLRINSLNINLSDMVKVTIGDMDLLADINRDWDIDSNDNNSDETSKGMLVNLNADDDDHNGTADTEQVVSFPDNDDEEDILIRDEDDELTPVIVNICPESLPKTAGLEDATVTLEASGSDKIRLWIDRKKTRQLVLPYQWQDLDPKTIYVEGISASNTSKDICLKIVYHHGTIQTEVDKINISVSRAVRIPIEYFSEAKGINIIQGIAGIIYVPTDGFLTVSSLDSSSIKLYYIGSSELDFDEINSLICSQKDSSIVADNSPYCHYEVATGKQGWYYVRLMGSGFMNVNATFVQDGQADKIPWNGPYWARLDYDTIKQEDLLNLYEDENKIDPLTGQLVFDGIAPLKKYDLVYGTNTKEEEEGTYSGGSRWEGHCNGWAIASILTDEPIAVTIPVNVRENATLPVAQVSFSQTDMKGLYSELWTDKSVVDYKWQMPSVSGQSEGDSVSGIFRIIQNVDPEFEIAHLCEQEQILKCAADDVQNAIKLLRTEKKALYANLRALINNDDELRTPRELTNISKYELRGDQIWNYAVYRYKSEFAEDMNLDRKKVFEVRTKIGSNDDCGADFREDIYIFRFQYNSQGGIVHDSQYQEWRSFSNLAPGCIGTVSRTWINSLLSGKHCSITEHRIDELYSLEHGIDPEDQPPHIP